MIKTMVTDKDILSHKVDCYGYFVSHNALDAKKLPADLKRFQDAHYPDLSAWLTATKFKANALETRTLSLMIDGKLATVVFVGLGSSHEKTHHIERYRRAVGKLVRAAKQQSAESLAFALPQAELFEVETEYLAQQTAVIADMANYYFGDFITSEEAKDKLLKNIVISADKALKKEIERGLHDGSIIGHAVNNARHWIDLPPSDLTPDHVVSHAKEIARKSDLKITTFNEKQINAMGMGGLGGVSRGSELDCHLIVMEYQTKKKNAPTVAFVGKGITFDSGGLSLKPAASMETMKDDMSGAAAVINVMGALAELKPDINVIGVAAVAENMPSGTALKPGDIVRFYNGKTAEVKNTDAEGRLILADALSYAVKHYKLDAIIDIATLTGACPIALGPYFTAVMSQHDELIETIYEAADLSGDRVWELPLDDDFKPSIKTPVADMANITDRKYGAQTVCAAFFLQHFVSDVPWAHLDIAGTAFDVPDLPYYRPGATGAGVRLLIAVAMNWDEFSV
jgi:leucyl aminopeptidase